jgi:MOB kinase activator 1
MNIGKQYEKGSKRHELHRVAKATLGSGDLSQAVKLPVGEDLNEWLAVNTVDFFNTTNLLYGSITEFCTNSECPTMTAGPEYEYFWMDGVTIKKPIKCTAPEYVDFLMTWVEKLINDEKVFPASPSTFMLN